MQPARSFDPKSNNQIVHFLPGQSEGRAKGGTLRLGSWPCVLQKDTKAHAAYKRKEINERHRHRYEFNNEYREMLEKTRIYDFRNVARWQSCRNCRNCFASIYGGNSIPSRV